MTIAKTPFFNKLNSTAALEKLHGQDQNKNNKKDRQLKNMREVRGSSARLTKDSFT